MTLDVQVLDPGWSHRMPLVLTGESPLLTLNAYEEQLGRSRFCICNICEGNK